MFSCLGYKRKYDWDAIWKLHKETGYGHKQLSKQLDIPLATIASRLHRYCQKMNISGIQYGHWGDLH